MTLNRHTCLHTNIVGMWLKLAMGDAGTDGGNGRNCSRGQGPMFVVFLCFQAKNSMKEGWKRVLNKQMKKTTARHCESDSGFGRKGAAAGTRREVEDELPIGIRIPETGRTTSGGGKSGRYFGRKTSRSLFGGVAGGRS